MDSTTIKRPQEYAIKRLTQLETKVAALMGELDQLRTELQGSNYPHLGSKLGKNVARGRTGSAQPALPAPKNKTGLTAALARGEAAKVAWVDSGQVIPTKQLSLAWGMTPQRVNQLRDEGDLFSVVVKRHHYYPKEFLDLERLPVSAITKALGNLPSSEKLIFWKRPHGALGGKTVAQSLQEKGNILPRITELAHAWADEAHARNDVAKTASA